MSSPRKSPGSLSRRALLRGAAAGALAPSAAALLGCSEEAATDEEEPSGRERPEDPELGPTFRHGVASGDPLADRVVLWTRVTTDAADPIEVEWELASDEDFTDIVTYGTTTTSAARDHTVKVDASGLTPGASYYYRFRHEGETSVTGRTRTLPKGSVDEVRFAVVSCSNYPAGYFHAYREIAGDSVDVVLHLGDYTYEYGMGEYATENAESLERVPDPSGETLTLEDYRKRYAQYRSDRDLERCHAAHPFIVVWDDHEVCNDAYRSGAENHQSETEGEFEERRRVALQAYFEWLPLREPEDGRSIYRRFAFGDLVDLFMLDTRLVGRDLQLSYADYLDDAGSIEVDAARAAIDAEDRSLLGEDQLGFLVEGLADSTSRWQVLGQQVLFGRYWLPASVLAVLNADNLGEDAVAEGTRAIQEAVAAAKKPEAERSEEEQALLDSAIPYNLDAWDGYAAERRRVLEAAAAAGSRLLVLSGDTHNAWASTVRDEAGRVAAVEFAGTSISSPGLDEYLGSDNARLFQSLLPDLLSDLAYVNLLYRGYLRVSITAESATAEYLFVTEVTEYEYDLRESVNVTLVASADLELSES